MTGRSFSRPKKGTDTNEGLVREKKEDSFQMKMLPSLTKSDKSKSRTKGPIPT